MRLRRTTDRRTIRAGEGAPRWGVPSAGIRVDGVGTGARAEEPEPPGRDCLGAHLLDEARQWSLFLVGAHDLGKASPSFQCKWAPSVLPLQQLGYRFPVNVMPIPHGRVSSIALARILEARGVERRVANEIARAVGGHHGVFDTASALQQSSPQAVGEGLWEESRKWIIDLTCPLKTNPNLERESKDSGVCKEAGNDEEAIHERTDYPQAEGSRS